MRTVLSDLNGQFVDVWKKYLSWTDLPGGKRTTSILVLVDIFNGWVDFYGTRANFHDLMGYMDYG